MNYSGPTNYGHAQRNDPSDSVCSNRIHGIKEGPREELHERHHDGHRSQETEDEENGAGQELDEDHVTGGGVASDIQSIAATLGFKQLVFRRNRGIKTAQKAIFTASDQIKQW